MALMRHLLQTMAEAATLEPRSGFLFPEEWRPEDWDLFIGYAHNHRVTPLLAHRIQEGILHGVPESAATVLQKELHQTRLRHGAALQELEKLESAFRAKGIPMISLKGPHLAEEAYATTGLRPFDDLDLLIEPGSVNEAQRALVHLGYRTLPRQPPAWLVQRYHFHTQWMHPETRQCVELHWRPADRRTLPDPANDLSYLADLRDNPAALPIYLAVHLAKHGIANEMLLQYQLDPLLILHPTYGIRLIWLLDFNGIMAARQIKAEQLEETAKQWNASRAWEVAQYLSQRTAIGNTVPLPRFSIRARLLRAMGRDLDQPARPIAEMSWWLRPHARTGFRPIRLLDLLPGSKS